MARIRQSDIAERLGVSQQAVAYALSERPAHHKKLSLETRQRILNTARKAGYVPHQAARSLRRGQTDNILVTTQAELHMAHVHLQISALHLELVSQGKEMLLELGSKSNSPDRVLRMLFGGSADALIVLGDGDWLAQLLYGLPDKLPKVMIGPGNPPGISSVEYDRVWATELAVTHLLEQGHRQVAMVYDFQESIPSKERLRGHRLALKKRGLKVDESLLFRAVAEPPNAVPIWEKICSRRPLPTAIFCYNDELALALIQAIRLDGLRVPEDVALVTMGDSRFTQLGDVPLTTVDMNPRQIAQVAVKMLLEQIQTPDVPVRRALVEPSLVVRASTLGPQKEMETDGPLMRVHYKKQGDGILRKERGRNGGGIQVTKTKAVKLNKTNKKGQI